MWVSALKRLVSVYHLKAWAPQALGKALPLAALLCAIPFKGLVLAGPGFQETLTFSPAGFTALELALSWIEEPFGLFLEGRWGEQGFTYGGVGGSFFLEAWTISARIGVEVGGAWTTTLGASFVQAPLSLSGKLSFSHSGFTALELGASYTRENLALEGALRWEASLNAILGLTLDTERFLLRTAVTLGLEGVTRAQGALDLRWDLGVFGLGFDFFPTTRELFVPTTVNLESEHISLGFTAVWTPFLSESLSPAALAIPGGERPGLLRFLKELKLGLSVAVPEEALGQGAEEPLAFISSPTRSTFIVGQDIFFSARGSRSARPIRNVLWDFGDGTQARGMETRHRYVTPGVYQVTLYVWDQYGNLAQTKRSLRIVPPGISIDFSWEPKEPSLLDTVCFQALVEGEIVYWHWDFGDGSTSELSAPCHRYQSKGTHRVSLTVRDRYGNEATTSKTLVVVNLPPQANPGGPYHGLVNTPIEFSGVRSGDPDGQIVEFLWDFGDGTTARGVSVSHVYRKPGVYRVCLRVVDNDGAQAEACTTVVVLSQPSAGGHP